MTIMRASKRLAKQVPATNNLSKLFERVYCVNLARRPDRRERFLSELPSDWPFKPVEFVDAIDGRKVKQPPWFTAGAAAWGCYRSHVRLIENCLNDGVDSVLLLEDDATFIHDFSTRVAEFIEHLPPDWGMVYFGGQHLYEVQHPPIRINEWVYRPYNVNRTHAFALRGPMMLKVYQHLCRQDWGPANHIDHHLGRLHQRRQDPIYCPREWLVGQAEGRSNISGRETNERWWKPAEEIITARPEAQPFVAVLGLHSSGSSAIAGVLYHLGVDLGRKLVGFYGQDPQTACGFEAQGLRDICERAIPFPATSHKLPRGKIWSQLSDWINQRRRDATANGKVAGGKYPQLCRLGRQLQNICRDRLLIVHCDRPLEESITSLIQRGDKVPRHTIQEITEHQKWLWNGKQELLAAIPEERQISVSYDALLANPAIEVARLAEFLYDRAGLLVADSQMAAAIASVRPNERHVTSESVGQLLTLLGEETFE